MEIKSKVAIITGGASGIGEGLVRRFIAEGASGVVVADLDIMKAQKLARQFGERATAVRCDVSREEDIQALSQEALDRFGRVDVYISNAGILGPEGGIDISNDIWNMMWGIHVMAHVWGARHVLPEMLKRGEGYFIVTASAAGLLNIVETAPYGVTKHAAVAFAEWLRIAYGRRGIRVSCLCPQSVATPMTARGAGSAGVNGVLSAEDVAEVVVQTIREERFLSLPHPEVLTYIQGKAENYDRWLSGMQKIYNQYLVQSDTKPNLSEQMRGHSGE